MFRYHPPPDVPITPMTQAELRARARELVLLELKHQPLVKAGAFAAGFVSGAALALGIVLGAGLLPVA